MVRVGIVGGTGYTGVELLRLLSGHPRVELAVITSRAEAGVPVADLYPNLRGHVGLAFSEPDIETLKACDLVFFATPNGTAMKMVPELLETGVRIFLYKKGFVHAKTMVADGKVSIVGSANMDIR